MRKNIKREINKLIDDCLPLIQEHFDGVLDDEARRIITMVTNQALNLVRYHELDFRSVDSECFMYDNKGKPIHQEDSVIEFVMSSIYMKLVDVPKKEKSDFLGISKNDSDSMYNWKRHDCSRFVRYAEDFEETLLPLEITPDELFSICSRRHNDVDFENLFEYYLSKCDEDILLDVVRSLFSDLFWRCPPETQEFLIEWTKEQLHKRATSRIQHNKIDVFISNITRFANCSRAMQMILCKICDN